MVAGALVNVRGTFNSGQKLVYIGDCESGNSKTLEVITTHPDGVKDMYSIITIGRYGDIGKNSCFVHAFYGVTKLYTLKGTNKVFLLLKSLRQLKCRLIDGQLPTFEIINNFQPETMTEYEEIVIK